MHIARIIKALALPVTSQAIADLALQADQDRRAALRRGDMAQAEECDHEVAELCNQMARR